MSAPLKLAVLCSGSGSNLQAIIDAVADGSLNAEIRLVLTNKPQAKALDRAKVAGIPTACISHKEYKVRTEYDGQLVKALREAGADWVVLAGFMRIVTPVFLNAFKDRVVNIHPSLLPAFVGVDGQSQAFNYGTAVAGCTVHFVDAGTDTGPVIAQAVVPVLDADSRDDLQQRILAWEHRIFVEVLRWISEDRVSLHHAQSEGGRRRVSVRGKSRAFGLADPAE